MTPLLILGEALMDCLMQPDGSLRPLIGGSPYNLARAAALQGTRVGFLTPFSRDTFGQQLKATLQAAGAEPLLADSPRPTSLAVVTVRAGQPAYAFYREDIADRDFEPETVLRQLRALPAGVLHTGSLMLMPPESDKTLHILRGARALGWTISLDVNLRPQVARDLQGYVAAVWQGVALADWIKASEEDLATLGLPGITPARTEYALPPLLAHGARRIALTFGAAGACLWVEGQQAGAAAPAVAVVDTVGAGDTFWATCLSDWIGHPNNAATRAPHTLHRALRAAAINCARAGCQPPRAAELDAALAASESRQSN